MRVVSLNVGLPREVSWHRKPVLTGIYKEPVSSRVMLRTLNLDGDRQADLSVHGGKDKAAYAYPVEHYAYWRSQLPETEFPFGIFGENFTTEGLLEDTVCIGDSLRIGEAEVVVTQPRLPCFKLGIKFGRPEIVKEFLQSRRTGFYFAVLREGHVAAGDPIQLLGRDETLVTVAEMTRVYAFEKDDLATVERALRIKALSESWRQHFQRQFETGRARET